jgi:hypothetical protein
MRIAMMRRIGGSITAKSVVNGQRVFPQTLVTTLSIHTTYSLRRGLPKVIRSGNRL